MVMRISNYLTTIVFYETDNFLCITQFKCHSAASISYVDRSDLVSFFLYNSKKYVIKINKIQLFYLISFNCTDVLIKFYNHLVFHIIHKHFHSMFMIDWHRVTTFFYLV